MNFNKSRVSALSPAIINILNRTIGLLGSLGLLLVVLLTLDPNMQGFYYTFYSLIFMRFFAELGLNFAVVQIVSHAFVDPKGSMKCYAYVLFFTKWFAAASCLLFVVLVPAILLFHEEYVVYENFNFRIIGPWLLLALGTSFNVAISGQLSIFEGLKRILLVSKIRLGQSVANVLLTAGSLMAGAELWSLAIGSSASAGVGILSLYRHRKATFQSIRSDTSLVKINWKQEVWPFQWRLGMSWVSGFFIFYFLTPMVMRTQGAVAAGQIGMSFQMFQAINSVAILFVSTHSASFGGLVAKKKLDEMNVLFRSYALKSSAFLIGLLIVFWSVNSSASYILPFLDNRLLPNYSLFLLSFACICNHLFFVMNYYLRSYKDEYLWSVSVANSLTIFGLAAIFVPVHGVTAAVEIYVVANFIFWVVIGVPQFLKRKTFLEARFGRPE